MNTHADKTQENKSQSVSNGESQMQGSVESTVQFVDNRPEVVEQRSLQKMMINSPQINQLKAIQEIANNNSLVLQRTFQHKGKTYGPNGIKDKVPKIHKVSASDLEQLRDDEHDYGKIENLEDFEKAINVYKQQRDTSESDDISLEDLNEGHITLHTEEVEGQQNPVKIIYQIDAFQGKHDLPFMLEHSEGQQRKLQDTQMRLSKSQYIVLAKGIPVQLAKSELVTILGKNQMERYDFSVMATLQSDGLYYEISAMWAHEDGTDTVIVFYHCFPPKKDEEKWNKYKKPKEKKKKKSKKKKKI